MKRKSTPSASCEVLFHDLPVGIAVFELNSEGYKVLFLNSLLKAKYGCTEAKCAQGLNGDLSIFVHPDDAERLSTMFYRGSVTGGSFAETVRMKLVNGAYSWTDIRMTSVLAVTGEVRFSCAVIDVDMRRENELKLERTYEELLGVMNKTPGGIIVFDVRNNRNLVLNFVSSGLYKLLQGTEADLQPKLQKDFYAMVHPDDREGMIRSMEEAIRLVGKFQRTIRISTALGTYILVDISCNVENVEGQLLVYMTCSNSSEDREVRRVLEHILDIFVRQQFDMICIVDGEHNKYRVLSAKADTGILIPQDDDNYTDGCRYLVDTLVVPSEREQVEKTLALDNLYHELSRNEDVEIYTTLAMPKMGERNKKMWFSWLDKDKKILALVMSDYTELRQEQLRQKQTLVDALKTAEEANIAKSEFLSRMSHDIRTPLNAIIGFTEMNLADVEISGRVRDRLEKVDTSSKFLLSLINDVLDMSRIESGKLSIQEQEFALTTLIEGVNTIIAAQCDAKGLVYKCTVAKNAAAAYKGDPLKLQQVLVNILGNAVKFTNKGGSVKLQIQEDARYEGHAMLSFIVEDTGIGISRDFLPHLFEPFTQENNKVTLQYGTGLGLAICKSIVKLMHGTIKVDSVKGQGTKFTIQVELGTVSPKSEAAMQAFTNLKFDFQGKRVLVAEDHPLNKEIAVYLLQKVGFSVDSAADGKIALTKFKDAPPGYYDVVLLDIRMPVMDGHEAAKAIRALARPDAHEIPLIAMSADAFEEDISASLASGINAHLIKPINPQELYKTLATFVK
jgi:two-component system sensor histidine kinase/response regulator